MPFDFLPGQYLNLSLMVDGKKVNRSYTIASSPTRVGYCELTVKREERGLASRHLHDAVREGSLLDVSAPAGRFTFTGVEAESIVMIGGGVGITPLMAKIRYLTDLGWPGEIHLVFAVKTESDIIFRDELDYLTAAVPESARHGDPHPRRGDELARGARQDFPGIIEAGRPTALGAPSCISAGRRK